MTFKKRPNGNFICSIQDGRCGPSSSKDLISQAKTGETLKLRLVEVQATNTEQIQWCNSSRNALRPGHRIGYRRPHIRIAQFRENGAITNLDSRVNHAR